MEADGQIIWHTLDFELLQVVILVWLFPRQNLSLEKPEKASKHLWPETTSPLVTRAQKEGKVQKESGQKLNESVYHLYIICTIVMH